VSYKRREFAREAQKKPVDRSVGVGTSEDHRNDIEGRCASHSGYTMMGVSAQDL
jgi:hypothetical protein